MDQLKLGSVECLACGARFDITEDRCPECGRTAREALTAVKKQGAKAHNLHLPLLLGYFLAASYYDIVTATQPPHGPIYDLVVPVAMFVYRLCGVRLPVGAFTLLGIWGSLRSYWRWMENRQTPDSMASPPNSDDAMRSTPVTAVGGNRQVLRFYQVQLGVVATIATVALITWTRQVAPFVRSSSGVDLATTGVSIIAMLMVLAGLARTALKPVPARLDGALPHVSNDSADDDAGEVRHKVFLWSVSVIACVLSGMTYVLTGSSIAGLVLAFSTLAFIGGGPYARQLFE